MQSCLALIPDDTERAYLAYSGGLDSSVLLHLLVNSDRGFELVPWHINHGLLDAAAGMEDFCIQQARHYGLEIRVDRLDLGNIDSNIEAEARRRRYQIFAINACSARITPTIRRRLSCLTRYADPAVPGCAVSPGAANSATACCCDRYWI